MKILIGCEESQEVCKAFRERGHDAYSCDILPCSGGHPEWHLQMDVFDAVKAGQLWFQNGDRKYIHNWDLKIGFPPCTDLAVSGARWFEEKRKDGSQQKSIYFFLKMAAFFDVIENPIGIMSTIYRKPDQIIQPWQFGHGETKATCLWLNNGIKKLAPTNIVPGREGRVWKMPPSPYRAKLRSKTYPGIAKAMAEQWAK